MSLHEAGQSQSGVNELFAALNNPRLYEAACLQTVKEIMANAGDAYAHLLSANDPFELPSLGEGNTALHLCAKRGYTSVIRFLVDNSAFPNCDINIKNAKNQTSLDIAAQKGHFSIVQHLLKNKAAIPSADSATHVTYDRKIYSFLTKNSPC